MRLLIGECVESMRAMPDASFDAIVTDPPFTAAGGSTNGRSGGNAFADGQFFAHWLRAVFAEIRRVVKPDGCGFVFCDWRTIGLVGDCISPIGTRQREEVWRASQAIVWDRESIGLGAPFRNSWEMIVFIRGPEYLSTLPKNIPNMIRHRWPYGRHEFHGAEKPVAVVDKLLGWALPNGGHVLDPFAGSGTTLVAAAQRGIEATGIEIDPTFADIARSRCRGVAVVEAPAGPQQQPLFMQRDDAVAVP